MHVYVIDDEEVLCDSLAWLLESRDLKCTAFTSGEAFLEAMPSLPTDEPSCIVLDIRMEPMMSGVELFHKLSETMNHWPIIFLSGHGDISLAVATVKQGAFDFLEKPFADNQMVDRVLEALAVSKSRMVKLEHSDAIKAKILELSQREIAVMESILSGHTNREAAEVLQMAVRTVEVHRASLFKKMDVRGAVELVNLMQDLDV